MKKVNSRAPPIVAENSHGEATEGESLLAFSEINPSHLDLLEIARTLLNWPHFQ